MTAPVYALPERAEMTFVAARHETGDELEALGEGCRVAVAEELRRLAAEFEATRQEWREVDSRTLRSSGLGHAIAALTARADALDPEGATR
jgi:hypothetical protein